MQAWSKAVSDWSALLRASNDLFKQVAQQSKEDGIRALRPPKEHKIRWSPSTCRRVKAVGRNWLRSVKVLPKAATAPLLSSDFVYITCVLTDFYDLHSTISSIDIGEYVKVMEVSISETAALAARGGKAEAEFWTTRFCGKVRSCHQGLTPTSNAGTGG